MSLQDWLKNGWLTEHQTSSQEISDLLKVVERDLHDCHAPALSPDWRLNIAYNAALQSAVAALAAAGYRASRDAHHFRVIQSLAYTIGAEPSVVIRLDRFRKKRNMDAYERAGTVSDLEADEMVKCAMEVRQAVRDWLEANYPELLRE